VTDGSKSPGAKGETAETRIREMGDREKKKGGALRGGGRCEPPRISGMVIHAIDSSKAAIMDRAKRQKSRLRRRRDKRLETDLSLKNYISSSKTITTRKWGGNGGFGRGRKKRSRSR